MCWSSRRSICASGALVLFLIGVAWPTQAAEEKTVAGFLAACDADEAACVSRILATATVIQFSPSARSLCLSATDTLADQAVAVRRWLADHPIAHDLPADGVIVDAFFTLYGCRR